MKMNLEKQASVPSEGIYYCVPRSRQMIDWDILEERTDEVEGGFVIHNLFWGKYIKDYLGEIGLSESELKQIGDEYRGLPRGRAEKKADQSWVVRHGNDTPKSVKHLIIQKFGLVELFHIGEVSFEFDSHETMLEGYKKKVWDIILAGRSEFKSLMIDKI